jgi:hypothetical protein
MVTSVGNATTVVTNANLTGPITSSGNTTSVASQTGTGSKFVMEVSPTLVTPVIGVATGTSLSLTGTTASTSTTTGTLIVGGGAGIAGVITAGSIQNTPVGSTTASTGAFTTLAVSGNATVGGTTTLNGNTAVSGTNTFTVGTGATALGGALTVTGTLQVTGAATNTAALNAGASTTINFALSNIAYTTATDATITLTGLKDGGAYTLAFTATNVSNAVTFTAAGFTIKAMGTAARTNGKVHLYSFIVAGNQVYVSMASEN